MFPATWSDRLRRLARRARERLWLKPLVVCLLSVAGAFVAKLTDGTGLGEVVPEVAPESIETLLAVMAASMLVIATFAVASMVSAYASASSSATPRSFTLVVGDDVSQYALSTFIGAFIFSIVALTAVKNGVFGDAGIFTLFVLTAAVFAMVILTFVRWVDSIARLGRLSTTVDKVEAEAALSLRRRKAMPTLGGTALRPRPSAGHPVFATAVGYVQHVDVCAIHEWAGREDCRVVLAALPGTFVGPGRALAHVVEWHDPEKTRANEIAGAFTIGGDRRYDDDPRFGVVVLSEIAGRALSPAVNDPGTAIDIVGTMVRLFTEYGAPRDGEAPPPIYDRVEVPALSMQDLFDDAFTAIARDGAGAVEVCVRLQKGLQALASTGDPAMRIAALHHSRLAVARAEHALTLPHDVAIVREAAAFSSVRAPVAS